MSAAVEGADGGPSDQSANEHQLLDGNSATQAGPTQAGPEVPTAFASTLQLASSIPAPYSDQLLKQSSQENQDSASGGSSNAAPPKVVRIYCGGIFSQFSTGHARQLMELKQCRPQVYLLVGVCSGGEPYAAESDAVLDDNERCEAVRHCRYVDEVIRDAPLVATADFIRQHRLDFATFQGQPLSALADCSSGEACRALAETATVKVPIPSREEVFICSERAARLLTERRAREIRDAMVKLWQQKEVCWNILAKSKTEYARPGFDKEHPEDVLHEDVVSLCRRLARQAFPEDVEIDQDVLNIVRQLPFVIAADFDVFNRSLHSSKRSMEVNVQMERCRNLISSLRTRNLLSLSTGSSETLPETEREADVDETLRLPPRHRICAESLLLLLVQHPHINPEGLDDCHELLRLIGETATALHEVSKTHSLIVRRRSRAISQMQERAKVLRETTSKGWNLIERLSLVYPESAVVVHPESAAEGGVLVFGVASIMLFIAVAFSRIGQ